MRERARIGERTVIGRGSAIDNDVEIGARVKVQTNVYVTGFSVVEDDVFLGPCVMTTNDDAMGRHAPDEPLRGATFRRACRVGGAAVLVPGVEIGEEAFVAAGAVVTNERPAAAVVMGVPARVVRHVGEEDQLDERWRSDAECPARCRARRPTPQRPHAVARLGPDDLLAARADADEHDRHADEVRDEVAGSRARPAGGPTTMRHSLMSSLQPGIST